jgi:hypothetical protein
MVACETIGLRPHPGERRRGSQKKLLALAAVCGAAVFLAAPAVHADGPGDFAVGGFQGVGGVNKVGFSAHGDSNGANPSGYLTQTIPQGRKDNFTVTCLAVNGNHAAVGLTRPTMKRRDCTQFTTTVVTNFPASGNITVQDG